MKPHCGRHTTYDGWCPNCVAVLQHPVPQRSLTEWIEELEAALEHAANALDKWPDCDRTLESPTYSHAIGTANELRKLVNAERSRQGSEERG